MDVSVCGKEWIPLESSKYWTTWIIDQCIFCLPRTKIPWPTTMGRLVQPRRYMPFLFHKKMEPCSDEDTKTLTSTSMSLFEAESVLEESNSDETYSENSEYAEVDSWTARGRVIYLPKTKIPEPVMPGRLVIPRRYRMTFPSDDDWSYVL